MSSPAPAISSNIRALAHNEGVSSLRWQLLIISTVLVIASIILMGTTVRSLQNSVQEAEAAERTILEITTIESRLIDFDGTLKSYALTGETWFDKHLTINRAEMDLAVRRLRYSLRDDPVQLNNFMQLLPFFAKRDARMNYLRAPAHRSETMRPDMVRAMAIDTGIIRTKLWVILEAERAKRAIHHAKMVGEARKSFWLSVGIVTVTFLVGVSFFWVTSSISRRNA